MPPATLAPDHPARAPSKPEIDTELAALFARIKAGAPPPLPTVLISGTIRCGKTKVANKLARRTGLLHIKTDEIRNAFYLGTSEAEKRRIVKYVFRRLLLQFPTGLLIEGTALMDAPCELPLWAHRRGLAFHAIGYSFDTPEAKHRDLLTYRAMASCWTKRSKTDAEMLRFAKRLIRRSKEIRAFCATHGLSYFDLDSGRFDAERDRIVQAIAQDLRARQPRPDMVTRLRNWARSGSPDIGTA
jgi:hypothetical protein